MVGMPEGRSKFHYSPKTAVISEWGEAVTCSWRFTGARMVKELDLLESNHGCGPEVTQRYTVHLRRSVFPQPFGL
jgi:hypothetical protein